MPRRKRNKMTTYDQGIEAKSQHKMPCQDCPFARTAIPGWLGESTPQEYCMLGHSDLSIDCHVLLGAQCAGAAIYRANVLKRVEPPNLRLPGNTELVFATPMEFLAHHNQKPGGKK